MKYLFSTGVYLVEGVCRSAICDTRNGNVYSLNKVATSQLKNGLLDPSFEKQLYKLNIICDKREEDSCFDEIEEPFPHFVWFEVTSSLCNLHCCHCYLGGGNNLVPEQSVMTYAKWCEVILDCYQNGIRCCQFIGGEPFLYKDGNFCVLDLAKYARDIGYERIEIFTNCQFITDEVDYEIKKWNFSIATSVYSCDNVIHDSITGFPGSFARTVEAIRILRRYGVPIRAEVVLMSKNESTISETMIFLKSLGVRYRNPDPIRPSGRGADDSLVPSSSYIKKFGYFSEPDFRTSKQSFLRNKYYNNCLAYKLVITDQGDVLPCVFARDVVYGNVRNNSLKEILRSPLMEKIKRISKDNVLICRDCEFRYVCHDCRPLASDSYPQVEDSFYNYPNPRCTYNPYTGKWGEGKWVVKYSCLTYESF